MNKTFVLFLVYIARRRKKITIIFSALIITITSMTIWFIFRCCKDLYHIEVDLLYFGKYKLSISDLNELKSWMVDINPVICGIVLFMLTYI